MTEPGRISGEPATHPAAPTPGAPSPPRAPERDRPRGQGGAELEERVARILAALRQRYPRPRTALHHRNAFELLVATILSAQATDKKVNEVTPALFARFPTPEALAAADVEEVARLIQQLGLYRTKARNVVAAARTLVEEFGGQVPRTREELMRLPGVGRKTANVVLANAFGVPAIAVDTHVFRVARRLGLSRGRTPEEVERDLMRVIPQEYWIPAHHWLIYHGRDTCHARRPRCERCPLRPDCPTGTSTEGGGAAAEDLAVPAHPEPGARGAASAAAAAARDRAAGRPRGGGEGEAPA